MPETHHNEIARLEALFGYQILDTPVEPAFDTITQLAASICQTPIALISLVDDYRQWFKSVKGLNVRSTPREQAFCTHAIKNTEIMEINDAQADVRFVNNPLVTGDPKIRFYAGQPLVTSEGYALGTLCVIDRKPNKLNELQREQLQHLGMLVMSLIESHLHSLQRNIGNILEQSFNQIYLVDSTNFKIEYGNKAAVSALCPTGQDIKRLKLTNVCPQFERDIRPVVKAILLGQNSQTIIETLLQPEKEKGYFVEMRLQLFSKTGFQNSLIIIVNDISERKQSEQLVREARDFYQNLLRDFPLLIWRSDLNKKYDYFNETWLTFTGRKMTQEIGDGWTRGVHPHDLSYCLKTYQTAFEKQLPFEMEYRLKRHDGEYRLMIDWGRPYYDLENQFAGFIGALQDVTEQRGSQQDLFQHRATLAHVGRFNLLSEMATNLAHEINQPLTSISNYCDAALDIVKKMPSKHDTLLKAMTRASAQSKHAGGIIRHLREFLRRGSEQDKELVSVEYLISRTMKLIESDLKQKGIEVIYEFESQEAKMMVDIIQMEQVMLNLIRNAMDALTIKTRHNSSITISAVCEPSENSLRVCFTDNGPGVSSDLVAGPFEHFSTTKPNGLGLGLAISTSIIEAHGGKLWLDPLYSAGARFCFSLPFGEM